MLVIGLTGGIGMGKSTVAAILKRMGFPVFSADEIVRNALKKNGAATARVARLFPETFKRGGIDRRRLAQIVFGQPGKLRRLERILHPLVWQAERAFLQKARKDKKRAVVLEIPLLFETGADKRCDITLCVSAPRAVQKARVLARPNMTKELFAAIVAQQMPGAKKCKKANYVIATGTDLKTTEVMLRKLFAKLGLL